MWAIVFPAKEEVWKGETKVLIIYNSSLLKQLPPFVSQLAVNENCFPLGEESYILSRIPFQNKNQLGLHNCWAFLSSKVMATLRDKRKLAAVSRETQKSERGSLSQNTFVPSVTGEYNTQISEKIDCMVTIKLSQDVSRTESRLLAALSKLHQSLLNHQVRTSSGTFPATSRNNDVENQEPTRDRSHNHSYPKVELSTRRTSNSADSDHKETSHTDWAIRGSLCRGSDCWHPETSSTRSSAKGYSRSQMTKGAQRMRALCRSNSLSLRGFLSKPCTKCL